MNRGRKKLPFVMHYSKIFLEVFIYTSLCFKTYHLIRQSSIQRLSVPANLTYLKFFRRLFSLRFKENFQKKELLDKRNFPAFINPLECFLSGRNFFNPIYSSLESIEKKEMRIDAEWGFSGANNSRSLDGNNDMPSRIICIYSFDILPSHFVNVIFHIILPYRRRMRAK